MLSLRERLKDAALTEVHTMTARFTSHFLLLAVVGLAGCELPSTPVPRVLSDPQLGLGVFTPDGNATRYILAVGDTGYLPVDGSYNCGAAHGYPYLRCPIDDGDIEMRISDEHVAIFASARSSGIRTFVAKAPGTIQISAATSGLVSMVEVEVVAVVPPVDSIRVRPRFASQDSVSVVADAAGNLLAVTLSAVRQDVGVPPIYAGLSTRVVAYRGGDSTVYLPVTIESSSPAVAGMTIFCWFGELGCNVPKNTMVKGLAPGTATVTITARNQQFPFLVTVR